MIDEFAKKYVHDELRWIRETMLWKLEGLSEYDIRRPLTATGTNLLGLVKHLSVSEARYFSEVFNRPFPEPLPRWDDAAARSDDMWASEHETRAEIIDRYQRAWEHSDATIDALPIERPRLRALVAAPERETVQHHGPHPQRDQPAPRTCRHPARTTRRRSGHGRGDGGHARPRRGLLGESPRNDRAGRQSG